jgi:hypothetical protein
MKRFDVYTGDGGAAMHEIPQGRWVKHEDVAALEADLAAMKELADAAEEANKDFESACKAYREGNRKLTARAERAEAELKAYKGLDWELIKNVVTSYQMVKSGRSLDEHIEKQLAKIHALAEGGDMTKPSKAKTCEDCAEYAHCTSADMKGMPGNCETFVTEGTEATVTQSGGDGDCQQIDWDLLVWIVERANPGVEVTGYERQLALVRRVRDRRMQGEGAPGEPQQHGGELEDLINGLAEEECSFGYPPKDGGLCGCNPCVAKRIKADMGKD